MATNNPEIDALIKRDYEHGFVTDIEMDTFPCGLNEDIVRAISAKKNEPAFLLEWRLKAYRHWVTMTEPRWAQLNIEPRAFLDAVINRLRAVWMLSLETGTFF